MKKLLLLSFLGIMTLSCSSDSSSSPALDETPDAKAQYDDSSFGVYKGVFVGSSGTIQIDIYNNGTATANLTINGSSKTFTSNQKVTEDFAIEAMTFTNGNNYFDFNVNGEGSDPHISNIYIYGHPDANIAVTKELSNSLVKCFTGTYTGSQSGIFNIITKQNSIYGVAKDGNEYYSFFLNGTTTGNHLAGTFEGGTFSGTLSGNQLDGLWQNIYNEHGNWTATRKL